MTQRDGSKPGPGRYNIHRRNVAMKEIRRLIVEEGCTNAELQLRLGLPKKTLERYIQYLYETDILLQLELHDLKSMAAQINIFVDRVMHQWKDLIKIAMDEKVEVPDRIAAHELAMHFVRQALLAHKASPALVARQTTAADDELEEEQQEATLQLPVYHHGEIQDQNRGDKYDNG